MKDYVCTHCGGKISTINMRYEYCGTQYKIEHEQILRIETYNNPVETFGAEQIISHEMIVALGAEKASEIALKHLSQKLAECITPMMRVETEYDHYMDAQRVKGIVKIIRPVK